MLSAQPRVSRADNGGDIWEAAAAHFQRTAIEDLVEYRPPREMLIDEAKNSGYPSSTLCFGPHTQLMAPPKCIPLRYSLKNIPIPSNNVHMKALIGKIES